MTRRIAILGVAALALAGSAAVEAQPARQGAAGERPRFEQPQRGPGMGMRPGFRRGPGGPGRPGGPGMALRGLDLTDEQKAQIKAIHEKTRAEVEALLTPAQLELLKKRRAGRGGGFEGR